jgi:hypothetical protein
MEGKGTMRGKIDGPVYEPPELRVLGTLHELTLGWCIFDKTYGDPDFWNEIPITNCSD